MALRHHRLARNTARTSRKALVWRRLGMGLALTAAVVGLLPGDAPARESGERERLDAIDTAWALAADRPAARSCRDLDDDGLCSPLETIRGAGSFIQPFLEQLEAAALILPDGRFADAERHLATGRSRLAAAGRELAEADPCAAALTYRRAVSSLRQAAIALARVTDAPVRVAVGPAQTEDDVRPEDMERAFRQLDRSRIEAVIDEIARERPALQRVCKAVAGRLSRRGVVTQTDEANGIVRLVGGETIELARGVFGPGLVVGRPATFDGIVLEDGSGIATSIQAELATARAPSQTSSCLVLRVAPVQPMAPEHPGPVTLHHIAGYRDAYGKLQLEAGMSLGVERKSCPSTNPAGKALVYGMSIQIERDGALETLATDLDDGEKPVALPDELGQNGSYDDVTIVTRVQRRACTVVGLEILGCQAPVTIETKSYPTRVRRLGAYSFAIYDSTVFGVLEDELTGNFDSTFVSDLLYNPVLDGTNPTFAAQGYELDGGLSTYPVVKKIGAGEIFAVHETDFYDPDVLFMLDQVRKTGQRRPSALRWAHVTGSKNGFPYRYSTSLPAIARDRVAQCALHSSYVLPKGPERIDEDPLTPPTWPPSLVFAIESLGDSLYKLPFANGFQPGTGLMNVDDPTIGLRHYESQAFALDLGADYDTPLHAARGGIVAFVEDSDPYNLYDPARPADWPKLGNFIFIEHQDGTFAVYFHNAVDSAMVEAGDVVERGDPIALVGDTGKATGAHVHFGVATQATSSWLNERVRYEALVGPEQAYDGCYVPLAGAEFYSTNE